MERDLSLFTVGPTDSLRLAMEKIDRNKHRVVVVVDEGRVLGTVSDGDVRRAYLHEQLPITPVSQIMQLNPHVTTETDPERRRAALLRERVTVLPVVDEDNVLLDVELAYEPFAD
ncbi:MAG: CBS domain-containing protein [Actinobacteria bacterium]|nr:CBS domain-containing protein [Actinomycetota bacterium]